MEWLLQVVDEIDDVVGVVRHLWLGVSALIQRMLTGLKSDPAAARPLRIPAART